MKHSHHYNFLSAVLGTFYHFMNNASIIRNLGIYPIQSMGTQLLNRKSANARLLRIKAIPQPCKMHKAASMTVVKQAEYLWRNSIKESNHLIRE